MVNALSEKLEVEVARGQQLYRQTFVRGTPKGALEKLGKVAEPPRHHVRFNPDPQIFGEKAKFDPARLFRMARAKAYLFGGVEIRWSCDPSLIKDDTPAEARAPFPERPAGLSRRLDRQRDAVHPDIFAGSAEKKAGHGAVEWAIAFVADADGFVSSYCNTIPTPDGGTHEAGCAPPCSRACAITRSAPTRKSARP